MTHGTTPTGDSSLPTGNDFHSRIRENIALAGYTTIGLGGAARYFVACRSDDEIVEAIRFARRKGLRIAVLGGGSNTLVPDDGFDGLVVHIETRGIRETSHAEWTRIVVAAGEPWDGVVQFAADRGLAGLECLSGIPGSTGATPIQNVGAYGQEVSETIVAVEVLDLASLETRRLLNAECGFSYRSSRFKGAEAGSFIVITVAFQLSNTGMPTIAYAELEKEFERRQGPGAVPSGSQGLNIVRDAVLDLRKKKSMVIDPQDPNSRSLGSFFTNPFVSSEAAGVLRNRWADIPLYPSGDRWKVSAAWLVEHAGFPKGYRSGGAAVSDNHALALVNRGTTTRELLALSSRIQECVLEKFAVQLEREPVVLR